MRTFWVSAALMAACSFASAQTILPTTSSSQQVIVGTNQAQVNLAVNLVVPPRSALHLTTPNLDFDLSQIARQDSTWYCDYGKDDPPGVPADADTVAQTINLGSSPEAWGQSAYWPLGGHFETTASFPKILVVGGPQVTSYPPAQVVGGVVNNASKAYFVCYRSFILQKFSNLGNFKLTAKRDNPPVGALGRQQLFLQDVSCKDWGTLSGRAIPMYLANPGSTVELITKPLTVGTTGSIAASASDAVSVNGKPGYCRSYTSWLDDLVVVAVVVDGDKAGKNVATFTFTLDSSAAPFIVGANTPGNP